MKRSGPLNRTSPKRRALNADVPADYAALVAMTIRCEFCSRRRPLEPHHLCQGGLRASTLYDVKVLLMLCRCCHDEIHRLSAANKAIGLALLRHAGRLDLEHFYRVTGRRWPDADCVELWAERLVRGARS